MNMREKLSRSPFKSALAYGALGVAALVGGNVVDIIDGPKESAPAEIAQFGGLIVTLVGAVKGMNVVAGRQVMQMRAERNTVWDELPELQDPLDLRYIVSRLDRMRRGQIKMEGVDPAVIEDKLRSTCLNVRLGAPRDHLLVGYFRDDIQQAIDDLVAARNGFGDANKGYITDSNGGPYVMADKTTQMARFLDDNVPIAATVDGLQNWGDYLSAEAGNRMAARLAQ